MIPRHYGIRTERYKLIHFYQFGNEWEMYDLKEDPDELTNIYGKADKKSLQKDLKEQLVAIRKFYDDNTDVSEKPDDPQALTILTEMESEFLKAQVPPKDAAMLYQAGIAFAKKFASGDIPKRALIELVSPMSDDLCSAFNLRTAKYLSNDCKVSKDSTLRWFPEEATKVIKIYYALFNGSALASPKAASD